MKNHETRPTGSTPFPETNATSYNDRSGTQGGGNNRGRGRRCGRGRGRGGGRGRFNGCGRGRGYGRVDSRGIQFKHTTNHQKGHKNGYNNKYERGSQVKASGCYRCGSMDHWVRACRTPKHLVELYEKSLKKWKGAEVNFVYDDGKIDSPIGKDFGGHEDQANTTHLEVGDFLDNE
uniref:keratin-associated protein 6-2-like n=1 Tax=Erigeron canadensis TaxID=72917 RepID=UPI001CB93C1D|nr:keratin-associated protein 6-2-like [Erigeron canadensis]